MRDASAVSADCMSGGQCDAIELIVGQTEEDALKFTFLAGEYNLKCTLCKWCDTVRRCVVRWGDGWQSMCSDRCRE
jgi:hypothetical protein